MCQVRIQIGLPDRQSCRSTLEDNRVRHPRSALCTRLDIVLEMGAHLFSDAQVKAMLAVMKSEDVLEIFRVGLEQFNQSKDKGSFASGTLSKASKYVVTVIVPLQQGPSESDSDYAARLALYRTGQKSALKTPGREEEYETAAALYGKWHGVSSQIFSVEQPD